MTLLADVSSYFGGGCFNPMVAMAYSIHGTVLWWKHVLVFVVAPTLGALIGGKICLVFGSVDILDELNRVLFNLYISTSSKNVLTKHHRLTRFASKFKEE